MTQNDIVIDEMTGRYGLKPIVTCHMQKIRENVVGYSPLVGIERHIDMWENSNVEDLHNKALLVFDSMAIQNMDVC